MVYGTVCRHRQEVVNQGDHIIRLLQERLSEQAAAAGDPLAFLALPKSREAVREAVRALDQGHDDVLGGWGGGRGGMKFPQVGLRYRFFFLVGSRALLFCAARHALTPCFIQVKCGIVRFNRVFLIVRGTKHCVAASAVSAPALARFGCQ